VENNLLRAVCVSTQGKRRHFSLGSDLRTAKEELTVLEVRNIRRDGQEARPHGTEHRRLGLHASRWPSDRQGHDHRRAQARAQKDGRQRFPLSRLQRQRKDQQVSPEYPRGYSHARSAHSSVQMHKRYVNLKGSNVAEAFGLSHTGLKKDVAQSNLPK
jgi:hypothetical protein